ncbi:MAG: GAF domain-containing protein [Erysipelotrichaceae bacterium]
MTYEANSMWDAMKKIVYKRTIKSIELGIKESTDLKGALTTSLDSVVTAAKAEAGTFWFHDREIDGRIRPFAVYGGGDLGDFSLGMGEGIAGRVIERSTSIIVEDCTQDPRWQGKADAKTGFVTRSMIVVPLCVDGIAFGCIQIINKAGGEFFDQQDLNFVEELANFSASMFIKLGFVKGSGFKKTEDDATTFAEIFSHRTELEMEIILRGVKEFSMLSVKDQQIVLLHTKEILKVFSRNKL